MPELLLATFFITFQGVEGLRLRVQMCVFAIFQFSLPCGHIRECAGGWGMVIRVWGPYLYLYLYLCPCVGLANVCA